jgi:uncharacterized protein (TIGR01777 family)
MHVAVSGAGGLIGSALTPELVSAGHRVTRLVRRTPGAGEIAWDPERGTIDAESLAGVDAVVHLAGETVDGRWTDDKKRRIRESRVGGTRFLAQTLARLELRPSALVCASAIGYYGDRGDEPLTEESESGSGFLAGVVRDWEAAARSASDAGIRVVNLRFGIVLSPRGGALGRMLTPFRLGVGGPLGSGEQYMSWVAIDDVAGAIRHALTSEELEGPVNVTAPEPVKNREFARTLGRVLGRPALARVPGPVLRLVLGEFSREVLGGQRVLPSKLARSGYRFRQETLEGALRQLLGRE